MLLLIASAVAATLPQPPADFTGEFVGAEVTEDGLVVTEPVAVPFDKSTTDGLTPECAGPFPTDTLTVGDADYAVGPARFGTGGNGMAGFAENVLWPLPDPLVEVGFIHPGGRCTAATYRYAVVFDDGQTWSAEIPVPVDGTDSGGAVTTGDGWTLTHLGALPDPGACSGNYYETRLELPPDAPDVPVRGVTWSVTDGCAPGGRVYAVTAWTNGQYTSPVLDAGDIARWSISAIDADGDVRITLRTGADAALDGPWTTAPEPGRYLQYRVRLTGDAVLAGLTLRYDVHIDADEDGAPVPVDCDDTDPTVHPGAIETCDGEDDDCDGEIDEDSAADAASWYSDGDADGFGAGAAIVACAAPTGAVDVDGDCDDTDSDRAPDATERCNGLDDDCDGDVPADEAWGFADADGDGQGDTQQPERVCDGGVATSGDCDDADAARHAGAEEICDGVDNDCDGVVPADESPGFADVDQDGLGDAATVALLCDGGVSDATDCDDRDNDPCPGGCATAPAPVWLAWAPLMALLAASRRRTP